MHERIHLVKFDRSKHPGVEFEILPLEDILHRKDLDHNQLNPHQISFYLLILITSGNGRHTIDFKEYAYHEGTILTIRKDQTHSFHPSSAIGHVLLFTEEFVLSFMEHASAQKIKEVFNELLFQQTTDLSPTELKEIIIIIAQITDEFNRYADIHRSSIIRNLLQVLISKIHRTRITKEVKLDQKYTRKFIEFQTLIEQHCTRSRAVQFYADRMNLTTRTLNTITQQILNKSPKTLIDELLVLQIKRKLINTDLSIKEIAYQSGFDEPTNLFKFFKRLTNKAPQSFRDTYTIQS
ncbi:MAG: helix-turn-helix transcriptional regulator [Bacteroidota bacterium]